MKETIKSLPKKWHEWKENVSQKKHEQEENDSRKKTSEELLLRESYILDGEFTGYMPEYPNEKIPDDIRNFHITKFNDSWQNKNRILRWMADVLKNILNIPVYEKLDGAEKEKLSHHVRSALWFRHGTSSFLPLTITPSETQIIDYSRHFDEGPESQYRVVTVKNKIKITPGFASNDQEAVDILTKQLAHVIKKTFPRCYINRPALIMYMQKQKGSLFSQLPKDVARIVARYTAPCVNRPR